MDNRVRNGFRKPVEEHYKKMSVSFTPELHQQLLDFCEREERNCSWVIRKALEQYFKDHP